LTSELFPIVPGSACYYAFVDYNPSEPEVTRAIRRVLSAAPFPPDGEGLVATMSWQWGAREPLSVQLRATKAGVWVDGSEELRFPVRPGQSWEADDDPYPNRTVLGVGLHVWTPDRAYDGCVEIGFTNESTDSGSRFYAPGVGLVKELWTGENFNSVLILVSTKGPSKSLPVAR
jgi:hypothetical protein